MKVNSSNRLLRNAEPTALGGDGPGNMIPFPAAAAAAAAPEGGAAPVPAPTFLEQVKAGLQSKGTLLSERDAAMLRAQTAEASLATATTELTALRAENATLKSERAEISAALQTAQTTQVTVEAAAASQVAAFGFPAAALPAASSEAEDTVERLEAKLEKETDAKQIVLLSREIDALKAKKQKA